MPESEYAKIIARNLRNIMYTHGKTQADVSRDLGINKATLSTWMNGTRIPRMSKIDLLCHYFNVTRADLMEDHGDPKGQTGYYLDPETAQKAQELFSNKDMRILFDAAQGCRPSDLQMAADLLTRLKETNPDG
jgi:transcriptional regulator with XRE-family HTH domain